MGIETISTHTGALKRKGPPVSSEHLHHEGSSAEDWLCCTFTTLYFAAASSYGKRKEKKKNQGIGMGMHVVSQRGSSKQVEGKNKPAFMAERFRC